MRLIVAESNDMRSLTFDVQQIILGHAGHDFVDVGYAAHGSHALGQRLYGPVFFEAMDHVITANHHGEVVTEFFCLFHKRPMPRVEQVERAKDEDASHGCSVADDNLVDLSGGTG